MENAVSYIEGGGIEDANGHGTMVAGVVLQIAPESVITPYRVISEKAGNSLWTIQAIIQAAKDNNDIINMSLGTFKSVDLEEDILTLNTFQRAVDYANSDGTIIISASGNYGLNLDYYLKNDRKAYIPGCLDGVISVSSENNKELASYSDYGSSVQFTAPEGELVLINGNLDASQLIYCIYLTNLDNGFSSSGIQQGYTFSYGTSFSAAEVTAALADILSLYHDSYLPIIKDDIILALAEGCIDIGEPGYDSCFGNGVIQIGESLKPISTK